MHPGTSKLIIFRARLKWRFESFEASCRKFERDYFRYFPVNDEENAGLFLSGEKEQSRRE